MGMRKGILALVVLAFVPAFGCGGDPDDPSESFPSKYSPVTDKDWRMVQAANPEEFVVLAPKKGERAPTIRFEDGEALFFTGCRDGSASVEFSGPAETREGVYGLVKADFGIPELEGEPCSGSAGRFEHMFLKLFVDESLVSIRNEYLNLVDGVGGPYGFLFTDRADPVPDEIPTIDSLDDRTFRSVAVSGAKPVADRPMTLSFTNGAMKQEVHGKLDDLLGPADTKGSLDASGGCNSMSGNFRITDGILEKGGIGFTTQVGCPAREVALDEWFDRFLSRGVRIRTAGHQLLLSNERGQKVEMTDSHPAVVGTDWKLDGVISPDQSHWSALPVSAEVRFLFASDGTVQFTTGCNTATAEADVSADSIRFDSISVGDEVCRRQAMGLEHKILGVLSSDPEIDFDGETFNLKGNRYGLEMSIRDSST